MTARIVITDHAFAGVAHERRIAEELGAQLSVHQCTQADETTAAVADADVVIANFAPIGREQLAAMAPGGVVVRYGIGVDNVDVDAATALGIRVANVPDYGVATVADHAAAMMLTLLRRLPHYTHRIRAQGWITPTEVGPLPSFHTMTIGLLGVGRISCALAGKLSGFGFAFVGYDPYASAATAAEHGVELLELDEVLRRSHGLSLHLPSTPETQHLLNDSTLDLLPPGAVIVNTSRGPVIDEAALARGIRSGRIAGAGLDVFDPEPLASDSPLRDLEQVVLSPHAAFYSIESIDDLQRLAGEEAARAIRGENLRCQINTPALR